MPVLVFVVVGTWAFVALALLLAGTLRAEAVLALANLLWVLFLAVGGVIVPRTQLPDGRRRVRRRCCPRPGSGDGLRSALVDGTLNLPPLASSSRGRAPRHSSRRVSSASTTDCVRLGRTTSRAGGAAF